MFVPGYCPRLVIGTLFSITFQNGYLRFDVEVQQIAFEICALFLIFLESLEVVKKILCYDFISSCGLVLTELFILRWLFSIRDFLTMLYL